MGLDNRRLQSSKPNEPGNYNKSQSMSKNMHKQIKDGRSSNNRSANATTLQ